MTLKCARCDRSIDEGTFCDQCRLYLSRGREYQGIDKIYSEPRLKYDNKVQKPMFQDKPSAKPSVPPMQSRAQPPSHTPPGTAPNGPKHPGYSSNYYQQQYYHYYYPYYNYYYGPYHQPQSDGGKVLAGLAILPSYLFLGIVLFVNLLMLVIGLGFVVPYTFENVGGIAFVYPWPPYLHSITLEGGPFLAWYLFLVAMILISVLWLFYTEGKNFWKIITSSAKRFYPPPSKSTNGFVMIAQLFFATIFFSYIVILIMVVLGIPITSPDSEPIETGSALPQLFYGLANASVAEEFAVRILYIGIPLMVINALQGTSKKWYRYFVGGDFDMTPLTVFFLIFSSAVFAMAHTTNWGYWKAIPTFVAGLALGYLYLRKGIHTSIILHFSIDYMILFFLAAMDSGYMGSAALYGLFLVFAIFVWFFVGMVFFGLYFVRAMNFVFIERFGTRKEPVDEKTSPTPEAIFFDRDQVPTQPQKAKPVSSQSTTEPAPTAAPVQQGPYPYPPPQYYNPYYNPYYYYYYYNYYYPPR
jgi:hypothetical protein